MCESVYIHVRLNFTCISLVAIWISFLDLISTYSLSSLYKHLNRTLCFNVHILILEFHNLTDKVWGLHSFTHNHSCFLWRLERAVHETIVLSVYNV